MQMFPREGANIDCGVCACVCTCLSVCIMVCVSVCFLFTGLFELLYLWKATLSVVFPTYLTLGDCDPTNVSCPDTTNFGLIGRSLPELIYEADVYYQSDMI